jgi:hypothetical protein
MMINPWNFVSGLFNDGVKPVTLADNTIYQVETNIGKYCGQIIYQDEVCMRLRHSKEKPVKILKTNIARINIAKQEAVEQYLNLLH